MSYKAITRVSLRSADLWADGMHWLRRRAGLEQARPTRPHQTTRRPSRWTLCWWYWKFLWCQVCWHSNPMGLHAHPASKRTRFLRTGALRKATSPRMETRPGPFFLLEGEINTHKARVHCICNDTNHKATRTDHLCRCGRWDSPLILANVCWPAHTARRSRMW